jgi:hypothetical protein
VYGPTTQKRWLYADSKAMDEYLALAYRQERGLDFVIARLFNTVGPRQSGQYGMVVARFVQAAVSGAPLEIHGDGKQTRTFCHVHDTIGALKSLMEASSTAGEIFNVGSRNWISVLELAQRVLELTDVGLLLDTGHLALGGGDPTEALRDWGERINHVHVKDVRNDVLAGVIADRADMPEAWRRGVFCELGTGDVDLDGFFAELARSQYSDWLVVEQDMVPQSPQDAVDAEASQVRNRAWLTEHAGI